LSEQQTDTPTRQCQTVDNVTIDANASIYWKITDPVKAVYDVDVLPKSVSDVALNALRSNIGKLKLDQILSERKSLNDRIAAELLDKGNKWGITITAVEIQEINYSSETAEAMMQEMAAERKKRAAIAEAEGEAKAEVTKAEGEARAIKIRAEAEAEATQIRAEAEAFYISKLQENSTSEVAGNVVISQKYIDGMQTISKNPSDKVFLPNSFNGLFNISTDTSKKSE
ncbi:MAG: SPFH domain-containing protein, partial [bacterium]